MPCIFFGKVLQDIDSWTRLAALPIIDGGSELHIGVGLSAKAVHSVELGIVSGTGMQGICPALPGPTRVSL